MLLIPAIDLKDGHCVRLKQGDMDQATVFSQDPAEMARHWLAQGARRLHLVDLNGAFAGKPKNESAVKAILKAVRDFAVENDVDEIPELYGDFVDVVFDGEITHGLENGFDGGFVLRLACKGAVQINQMQTTSALREPVTRHFGRVLGEYGGLVHIALLQANAMTVFQVDGRYQQHGYGNNVR